MSTPIFTGACVAIVTPFSDEGIDYVSFGKLIDWQITQGIDAITVCGTTGEASTMPDEEHLEAIRYCIERVAGRVPVIAGVGSNDTKHAVELSRKAESLGADALLSVTPYYNKASQKGLYMHFKAIADSVSIPVVLYNVPGRTAVNLNPETVAQLASSCPNITAVKECNLAQVPDILNLCGDRITIYSGNDEQVLPFMAFGAQGVISVMANVLPAETHRMAKSFLEGDIVASRASQLRAMPLIKALFADVSPMPVKAAMNLMGLQVGECRMPLCDISETLREQLRRELTSYGVI